MSPEELDFLYQQSLDAEKFDAAIDWASDEYDIECLDDWQEFDIPEPEWTYEDEAALEDWEEKRRVKIAERNEY
jgi:hypothetical protein